ncbi:transcription-repair coupling factor [Thermovibrio ammonificans]
MFDRALKVLSGQLKEGTAKASSLPGASKALVLKKLKKLVAPSFVVVPTPQLADAFAQDLNRLGVRALFLPPLDVLPLDLSSPLARSQYLRHRALLELLEGEFDYVVLTPESLYRRVLPPEFLIELSLEFKRGETADVSGLPERFIELGFRRVDSEPEELEFSLKGSSLEFVTPLGERVVVEFFGDEVEELSVNGSPAERFILPPALELPQSRERLKEIEKLYPELVERHLLLGELSGAERLLPEVVKLVPVTEYTGELPLVVVEPDQVRAVTDSFFSQVRENYKLLEREGIPSAAPEEFVCELELPQKLFLYDKKVKNAVDFQLQPLPSVDDDNLKEVLKGLSGYRVTLVYQTETLREEAEKLAAGYGVELELFKGDSAGGFRLDVSKRAWLTESLFVAQAPKKEDVTALEPGTLVVHRDYGIGIFQGIVSREIGGKTYDFIEIEYAGGERLYAPFTQIDRIYRYTGYRGKTPKLDKLGGTSWKNLERRVKASLVKFAKELAQLYKERKSAVGERLKGDEALLREFERRFPYRLTPDQSKAIREVYRDMESERPMDRLICGDVGFGKTEVAMRAAMKAVTSGKQVAVIAPTTVLADQHYRTFRKRFKGFPVKIEMLSRFKSKKEQREILEKLKRGEVDIVIGTHRLTQDDVEFKDLGLLIIDEEHRFGVKTKEKLTKLKSNIDVLYLSATPIPRTLYSALSGFRDISLIETPPAGRRGTKVVVSRYSDELFKAAIERELARGGQVFIVQNDISKLEEIKEKVERLFPGVKVGVVHGQMRSSQIEKVMHQFFEGELQVLVSTAIVESGLDVPTANTLIVIGAERFGLSQLYQLKGRVGRGVEKGYCYLFTTPGVKLTAEAVKRLEAMKKLAPLGGGFQLALKDLEIRGAGTLLGPKQSGFVESVGLDLYMKLFEEVAKEQEESGDVKINLPYEAFIPEDFVEDPKEKLKLYSQLAASANPDELLEKLKEVRGYLPDPLVNLFKVMKLKRIAKELGVKEVAMAPSGRVIIAFGDEVAVSPERLVEFVKESGGTFTPDRKLYVQVKDLDDLINTLSSLKES